jgi:hypothetical protein
MWTPPSDDTIKDWIETILTEAGDSLNDWEINFMNDMVMKSSLKIPFTKAQCDKLEQIYEEKIR